MQVPRIRAHEIVAVKQAGRTHERIGFASERKRMLREDKKLTLQEGMCAASSALRSGW